MYRLLAKEKEVMPGRRRLRQRHIRLSLLFISCKCKLAIFVIKLFVVFSLWCGIWSPSFDLCISNPHRTIQSHFFLEPYSIRIIVYEIYYFFRCIPHNIAVGIFRYGPIYNSHSCSRDEERVIWHALTRCNLINCSRMTTFDF